MADNTLEKLVIELEAKGASGTDNIQKLADSLTSLGKATKDVDTGKLSDISDNIDKIGKDADGATGNIDKLADSLNNLGKAAQKNKGGGGLFGNLGDSIKKAFSGGGSIVQKAGDLGQKAGKSLVDKFHNALSGLKGFGTRFGGASFLGKIGMLGGAAFGAIGTGIKMALPWVLKFGKGYVGLLGNIGKFSLGKLLDIGKAINPLKAVGNAIDGLRSKLGMVARLGVIMLLRKAFTALITNAKQGIDNLAMYSDAMGTRFNQSMSTLVSDFKWAGNSLATAFEPILNVAIPIIDALITRLVAAMTAFANFIAALTGASTYTRAIKINENYAQSLNKGAGAAGNAGKAARKAAKDTKSYTTAIDELNILEPNKGSGSGGSGGGGGAGAGGLDPTSMFETVETSVKAQNWAQMLKDAWEKADFTQIGAIIGQKLKDALDYAHTVLYPKMIDFAGRFGKSLATFFNGFIEVDGLGYSIGTAIADALNTAAEFVRKFTWNFHFDSLGRFIMEGIEGALDNLDWMRIRGAVMGMANGIRDFIGAIFEDQKVWGKIGDGIGEAVNIGLDAAYRILKGTDFTKIGVDIATTLNQAFAKIDWGKLGQDLIGGVNALLRTLNGFLDTFDFKTFGKGIGEGIKKGIEDFDWKTFGAGAGNLFSGLIKGLTGLIEGVDFFETAKNIVHGIFDALGGVDWGEVALSAVGLVGAVIVGIVKLFGGVLAGLGEEFLEFAAGIGEGIVDAIKSWWRNHGSRTGVGTGLDLKPSVMETLGFDGNNVFNFDVGIKLVKDGWNTVKGWLDDLTGGNFSKGVGIVREGFTTVGEWIKSKFMGGGVDKNVGLEKTWSNVADWIKNNFMGGTLAKNVGLSKTWDSVASWIKNHMGGDVKKNVTINAVITGLTQKLKTFFGLYHGGIYSGGRWKGIPSYASGGMVGVRGAQLFMARETGNPELVGQIGSHPAVLNNGQITDMVARGVAAAVSTSFGKVAVALYKAFSEMQFVAVTPSNQFEGAYLNTGYAPNYDLGAAYTSAFSDTQAMQAASMKAAVLAAMTEFYATYDNGAEGIIEAINGKEMSVAISDREIAQANRRGARKLGAVIMA